MLKFLCKVLLGLTAAWVVWGRGFKPTTDRRSIDFDHPKRSDNDPWRNQWR